ncbi:MAG: tricarballylate utilization 4Fe-4S protein TcuB [Stellaceae bacterium]|jgi:citrate/tricarballylate utilization protein
MRANEAVAEARRVLEICNACRYCEGYCAVFPAMELRRAFSDAEIDYLANLCHDCRGCYYACQFAPPHEFGINLPKTFAQIRTETYEQYAWPSALAALFRRNGLVVSLITAAAIATVLALTMGLQAPEALYRPRTGPGAFYTVIPHATMALVGTATFAYALLALAIGFVRFWREVGTSDQPAGVRDIVHAFGDVLTLRNLAGGGEGCNDRDEAFSQTRRWLHHAMFYGFFACFAATCIATVYHYLGWVAPYPLLSAPVILGAVGGIALLAGTVGFLWVKLSADPAPSAQELYGAGTGLLVLLGLASLTGLALLALRETGAMGILLAIHLGTVLALFIVMPYSKFVHGVYRLAALIRYAMERSVSVATERE